MSRGWVLGTAEYKENLITQYGVAADSRAWETQGKAEIRLHQWETQLQAALRALNRKPRELKQPPAAQPWKLAIVAFLKERTQASNPWLAQTLGLPRRAYISRLVSLARHQPATAQELVRLREQCAT